MSSQEALLAALPFARRYARALTGTQEAGDALVAQALGALDPAAPPRHALYAAISRLDDGAGGAEGLGRTERQLLLLTALEELPLAAAAEVLGLPADDASRQLASARATVRRAAAAPILIIEDEPVIALDLRMLVERCGHRVVGIASSEREAEAMAARGGVGLILADVNLGAGGNGIAAVRRILETLTVPVIFVTAYPETLLTATGLEPAYVMRKPFDPEALAIATYQATTAGRVPLA
jgi:CheY-like chemotaxis protein